MGNSRRFLLALLFLLCSLYFFLFAFEWPSTLSSFSLIPNLALLQPDCPLGRFFVYDLPPEFNLDIVGNCSNLNPWTDYCDQLSNGGRGPILDPDLTPLSSTLASSWFATEYFTLEPIFHARSLTHPCRTLDVAQAVAFYVPFYAGLDVGRYLWFPDSNRTDYLGLRLLHWLNQQPQWLKYGGRDHFLAVGRVTWDFRRKDGSVGTTSTWGSNFFLSGNMPNTTRLLVERDAEDKFEIGIPYPTGFRPRSDAEMHAWQEHAARGGRAHLFSFAGAPHAHVAGDLRGILLEQCERSTSCGWLHCNKDGVSNCSGSGAVMDLFLDSDFCLQPRGDSFTRQSTFDSMLAGCIPVFFWGRTAYRQYTWHLPYDKRSYSVFLPRKAVRQGMSIEEALLKYSREDIAKMRKTIIDMLPHLVYAASSHSFKEKKDAFDISIDRILQRFKMDKTINRNTNRANYPFSS